MKHIFVENGIVLTVVHAAIEGLGVACDVPSAIEHVCDDSVVVEVGWSCTVDTHGVATFAAPAGAPNLQLSAMQFYQVFTPAERVAIKGSADALVLDFWSTYNLAAQTNSTIDMNLSSIQQGVQHLRSQGILASDERVTQVLAGIAQ